MQLRVDRVDKSFGGLKVLSGVSIEVQEGYVTGLIGPNGSGKTTLYNVICGIHEHDRGSIYLGDECLDKYLFHERSQKGIIRTFQIPKLAKTLSVLDNLLFAGGDQSTERLGYVLFRVRQTRADLQLQLGQAENVLAELGMHHLRDEYAGNLSGGQAKLLSLGMSLMRDGSVYLLDEPMAGVNPALAEFLLERIGRLAQSGKAVVIVEHRMEVISNVCERVYALHLGETICQGSPTEVMQDEFVRRAYLGLDYRG